MEPLAKLVRRLRLRKHPFASSPSSLSRSTISMVKARVLEERLIRMYKQSDGYFWIGGPGEEAFNIPLGLQVLKGQGLDYDYPAPALSFRRDPDRDGHGADRSDPPDEERRSGSVLRRPQLRQPLFSSRMERRSGHLDDRNSVSNRHRHGHRPKPPRRKMPSRSSTAATPARPKGILLPAWFGQPARATSFRS